MNISQKTNLTAYGVNKTPTILRCEEDYEKWYINFFDLTMFSEVEVRAAMYEERPEYYPCIPLIQENGYDVTYLGEDLLKHWFTSLYSVSLSPL